VAATIGAIGILLVGVAPMAAAAVDKTADPQIAEATDGAPDTTAGPAPPFDLVDQAGAPVSLGDLRGYTVVLTFLDPVCTTDCPIIAQELRVSSALLGSAAARVRFVAVVANPVYRSVQTVAAFDRQEGLDSQANWLFLTGSRSDLEAVWNAYGVTVESAPAGGMVAHEDVVYVIDSHGSIRRILDADPGPADASSQSSFSGLVASEVSQVQHP
jgi:cytochrome oxidase Cu insertion factor (SCO1/SenC/PrrC family)